MLSEIYIMLFVVAFIITYITHEKDSVIFGITGLIIWLILMAQALWITDVAGTVYNEFGISAFCSAFVFIHTLMLILNFLDWKKARGMP